MSLETLFVAFPYSLSKDDLLPRSVLALACIPEEVKTLPAGRVDTLLVWRESYNAPAFVHLLAQFPEG